MLHVLTPIAFIALASLAAPVLIHLWSRGVGRRVRVGSLRFLEETERRQLRTLRLSQIPLLLLRLALLAVLVVLLARPVWIGEAPGAAAEAQGWVLVHPAMVTRAALPDTYRTLDSLANGGASVRLLAPGFPPVDLDEAPPAGEAAPDVWSLLREADETLPDGSVITVVGPGRLAGFRGARPALRSSVDWIDLTPSALNRWIAAARWVGADSVRVSVGASRPTETRFAHYLVAASDDGLFLPDADGLTLDLDADRERVALRPPDAYPGDDALAIAPADALRRAVVVHSSARRDDARYVAAALRAVADGTYRPLSITTTTETDAVPEAEVLFWLHEDPAPEAVTVRVKAGLVLVVDAEGEAWQDVQRRVLMEEGGPGVAAPVLKRRVAALNQGPALWRDSAGTPLLEREATDAGAMYWFYSRFHPSAGTLVRSAAFPEWIARLFDEETVRASPGDRRRISPTQRMPLHRAGAVVRESKAAPTRLHGPLWVLAFILFGVERWIAHRHAEG